MQDLELLKVCFQIHSLSLFLPSSLSPYLSFEEEKPKEFSKPF